MAIERSIYLENETEEEEALPVEIETDGPEEEDGFFTNEDGSMIEADGLAMSGMEMLGHFDNLSPYLDKDALNKLSSDLVFSIENEDLPSREDWERRLAQGLKYLGIETEERVVPWEGASGVYHPILTEAVIAFQSNAAMELCPPKGPSKTEVPTGATRQDLARAKRVKDEMNYLIMRKMKNWRFETERLLFNLPCNGTAFKKVYHNILTGLPDSKFVPAQDVIANQAFSGTDCPRLTHRDTVPRVTIERLQREGFYDPDVDLSGSNDAQDPISEAEDEATGITDVPLSDDLVTIYEVHVLHQFDELGDEEVKPYIVTIIKSSGEVLSVRRNWEEDDESYRPKCHFVKYDYFPAFGFYSLGLIHVLGSGSEAATALMRQIIDAGTLSNVPSGFKASGFRIKGEDRPLAPGEFRDVDVPGTAISDNLHPLQFGGPNAVIFETLNSLVSELRRVASVADMKIAETTGESPVGTTLALLERSLRVMTACHARLHESLTVELGLIKDCVRDYMPATYEHNSKLPFNRSEDFAATDVVPVSNPNAASQAQRVIVLTGAINMAAQAPPNTYNMAKLHRAFVEALELPGAEEIVPLPEDARPMDPVAENMAVINQKPVKAFIQQDHEAHIAVHMAAIQSPKLAQIVGQSPQAQAIMAAMDAHIREHVAFAYRERLQRELGVMLPGPDEDLPDETDNLIARLAADASRQMLGKDMQEAQAQQVAQQMQDPVLQLQIREAERKDREVQLKEMSAALDAEVEREKLDHAKLELATKLVIAEKNNETKERTTGAQIGAQVVRAMEQLGGNDGEAPAGAGAGDQTQNRPARQRRVRKSGDV